MHQKAKNVIRQMVRNLKARMMCVKPAPQSNLAKIASRILLQ